MAHKKYYNTTGDVVPSVTTVISNNLGWNKQMLIAWSKKMALNEGRDSDEVKDQAAALGTITHYLIECKIKNTIPDISQYKKEDLIIARNGYLGFCDWEAFWKPAEYKHNEVSLVSNQYNYGGTIDIIASKDNKLHILDIKTSNHIHPEMVIQLAAYKQMFEENFNDKIDSCCIIKLSKDKQQYNFFPMTDEQVSAGWDVFKSLLEVQKHKNVLNKFGKE